LSRRDNAQLNIRSTFALARAHEIARRTGMTANEVIEDAVPGNRHPPDPMTFKRFA
jgi:hypothetical protein